MWVEYLSFYGIFSPATILNTTNSSNISIEQPKVAVVGHIEYPHSVGYNIIETYILYTDLARFHRPWSKAQSSVLRY